MSCIDGSCLGAIVRIPSPLGKVIVPNDSVVVITGTVFIQTGPGDCFIDTTDVKMIPAEAASFLTSIPTFFASHIECLGNICGEPYILKDRSIVFPISVSVYVHNEMMLYQLMFVILSYLTPVIIYFLFRCLYSGDSLRWCNTPVPSVGMTVQFSGMCSCILPSGLVAVRSNNIFLSYNSERPPRPPGCVWNVCRLQMNHSTGQFNAPKMKQTKKLLKDASKRALE